MKEPVDFHHLLTRHDLINLRLEEWARWVRVSPQRWMVQPMFRFARSNSRPWKAAQEAMFAVIERQPGRPTKDDVIDAIRAMDLEAACR